MTSQDPERRRKSPRLRGYDYRTPALYHIVTTTKDSICRFGDICDGTMHLNPIGLMIDEIWNDIPRTFPTVSLDASVVMPNHVHGVIFIEPQPGDILGVSLGDVMKWFKTVTTVRYSRGVHDQGWPPYNRKLWHRNYYEHIVRDDRDLSRIRDYIEGNPSAWDSDRHYPMPG